MIVVSAFFVFSLVIANVSSFPGIPEDDIQYVEPEFLDMLLETEQYDLFSELMGIENADLVRPRERARNENPMYHKELLHMDILPPRRKKNETEEERQAIRFERVTKRKWQGGYVPYVIASHYTAKQKKIILDAIDHWNKNVNCIKFQPRKGEADYVYYFNGDGCSSKFGREGGQQPISISENGCLYVGSIDHEMEHAIGIHHEMTRQDRDKYVEILLDNIDEEWQSQFDKSNPEVWRDILDYDYYSLMHYDIPSPSNPDLPAFKILQKGIDETKVGKAEDFTKMDLRKISTLYC